MMGYLFLVYTVLIICISRFVFQDKNKLVLFIYILGLAVIMGLNTSNADFDMYERQYLSSVYFENAWFDYLEAIKSGYSRDSGFAFLNSIFALNGIGYVLFHFIMCAMGLGIIWYVVTKKVRNISFVFFLYVMYPLFMDIIQVRNFMVEVLLLIGIHLLSSQKKYKVAIYIGLLLIAGTFHSMGFIYVLFIPFYYILKSRGAWIAKIFILIGLLVPLLFGKIKSSLFDVATILVGNDATAHYVLYVESNDMKFGYLAVYGYVVVMLLVLQYMNKIIQESTQVTFCQKRFSDIVYSMYLFCCCLLPISVVAIDALRWPRNLMIASYILLFIYIEHNLIWNLKRIVVVMLLLIISVIFAYWNLYQRDFINIYMILDNNVFFDLFDL